MKGFIAGLFIAAIAMATIFPLTVIEEIEVIKEVEVVKEIEVIPEPPSFDLKTWHLSHANWGYDCDDAALGTALAFDKLGYEYKIVAGNLNMINETLEQCNHTWVVVKIKGCWFYYENGGGYLLDKQHAEGYQLTKRQLLHALIEDINIEELLQGESK